MVDGFCGAAGFAPHVVLDCANTNMLFSLVSIGMGVSLFPKTWKSLFKEKGVAMVPLRALQCERTIRLVWSEHRCLSRAAAGFRDFIVENIGAQIEENFF